MFKEFYIVSKSLTNKTIDYLYILSEKNKFPIFFYLNFINYNKIIT